MMGKANECPQTSGTEVMIEVSSDHNEAEEIRKRAKKKIDQAKEGLKKLEE
jgi:hypothetical protein